MQEVIRESGHNISMWISETSSASSGGAPELSDRFVSGFLYLDKIGFSAKAGVQVLIRQSLFHGHYALIGPDLEPNPDWWVTVLFKKFVSNKVLNLVTPNNFGNVRFYAHCALKGFSESKIVIYGINLNEQETNIYLNDLPKNTTAFSYFLTSDNLQSRNILLNGNILKLQRNGSLPPLNPKQIIDINQAIVLSAFSLTFLLLDDIEFPPCE